MKDYSNYALYEAVQKELAISFVSSIKNMDTKIAVSRLTSLLNANKIDAEFNVIAYSFIMLLGTKTCADEY